MSMADELTHLDEKGRVQMVNVSEKPSTCRRAVARAVVSMKPATFARIMENDIKKGNVLETARIAGIMAAKRTPDLIPLCHPLNISHVAVEFFPDADRCRIEIRATAEIFDRTGVEMEALTAVSVAGLTIYDMCKAVDREMVISGICLLEKSGGRSGTFVRNPADPER